VAVIRDDDEERLSRADELLQQLRQQVEDLKHPAPGQRVTPRSLGKAPQALYQSTTRAAGRLLGGSCLSESLAHPDRSHRHSRRNHVLAAAFHLVTQRRIEWFCGDGRVKVQMIEAVFPSNAFDFGDERGPHAATSSARRNIARPQFRVAKDDGADAHEFSIDLSHEADLAVPVREESFNCLVGDRLRPGFDDGWRVIRGCDATNSRVMDLQEAAGFR
jgi:hypothetical protein